MKILSKEGLEKKTFQKNDKKTKKEKSYPNIKDILPIINHFYKGDSSFSESLNDVVTGLLKSIPCDGLLVYSRHPSHERMVPQFFYFSHLKEKRSMPFILKEIFSEISLSDPMEGSVHPLFSRIQSLCSPLRTAKRLYDASIVEPDLDVFSNPLLLPTEDWEKFVSLGPLSIHRLNIDPIKSHDGENFSVLIWINRKKKDDVLAHLLMNFLGLFLHDCFWKEEIERIFFSMVKVLASAIDNKSPHTGGHCRRVPILVMMMANAIEKSQKGIFKNFSFSKNQKLELELAAFLHDCGKVTTPVHVMDKSTKLETIIDGIHMVDLKANIVKKEKENELLKKENDFLKKILFSSLEVDTENNRKGHQEAFLSLKKYNDLTFKSFISQLERDLAFLHHANKGDESMKEEWKERVLNISKNDQYQYKDFFDTTTAFLSEKDVENLNVSRGTLNAKEREIINKHVEVTIEMLGEMYFPHYLKNIPEIAGGHHEKINGTGYPLGLKGHEMSVQARLMAIADIFEALTAKDRPYKPGRKLSETMVIMKKMFDGNEIDRDIFKVFLQEKVYLEYARQYLDEEQCDDISSWIENFFKEKEILKEAA